MPPEPLVLAFDTSAAHCAAALLRGEAVLAARREEMARGQAERLMPMLEEMLEGAGAGWRDLAALGVGTGPGNFTGIRIAVAAARGLALALNIPAVGVTGFEAAAEGLPRPVAAVLDARRGEVYAQGFGAGPETPGLHTPEALAALLLPGLPLTGGAAPALAALTGGPVLAPAQPPAEAIARIAAARFARPGPRPAPLYLRAADAAPSADRPPVLLP